VGTSADRELAAGWGFSSCARLGIDKKIEKDELSTIDRGAVLSRKFI
jgi:hypothetical protein